MDVEHSLTGVAFRIEDDSIALVRIPVLFRDGGRGSLYRAHERIIMRAEIVERGDVATRNNQDVQRRLRVDVPDGDELVVLVDKASRDLSRDDLAEKTVAHTLRITAVRGIPCRSARMRSIRSDGRAA